MNLEKATCQLFGINLEFRLLGLSPNIHALKILAAHLL